MRRSSSDSTAANRARVTEPMKPTSASTTSTGTRSERPVPAEIANRPLIRKSVVCAAPVLKAGTSICEAMLGVKRPWTQGAVEPFEIEKVLGLKLRRDKQHDEAILWSDFH